MRIEQTYLLHTENISQDYDLVKPGRSAEGSRMKDPAAKDRDLTDSTNHRPKSSNRKIEFFIHEKTGDIMAKVYDAETNEVIREIPPEKIKDMVANMLERAGLLVDKRA